MPVSPTIIDLREMEAQSWKNGAGLTREIAIGPMGATFADFDWRISVATIARDAPFSAFHGIDRCIVLLQGHGMQLLSEDGTIDICMDTPYLPFRFAGEVPMKATLIDGACTDFNVMVRRSRWSVDVSGAEGASSIGAASASLVFCAKGGATIDADDTPMTMLREGQAALWPSSAPSREVRAQYAGTRLLLVQLHALRQDVAS